MRKGEVVEQSKAAFGQWRELWIKNANENKQEKYSTFQSYFNIGIGRSCLLVSNGASLEREIETIKKNKGSCVIACVDKSLPYLIENGISPDFVLVCDAQVSFEKYCEPVKEKLKDCVLLINVCANPKWAKNAKWKDVVYFVNEDAIQTEKLFIGITGCPNVVPAATNVSNALGVIMTQSNNSGRRNHFGFDVYGLIGFDYCWIDNESYYANDFFANGKYNYMRHELIPTIGGRLAWTSTNLIFSARWFADYIKAFNLNIVQCSQDSILSTGKTSSVEKIMTYSFQVEHKPIVIQLLRELGEHKRKQDNINKTLEEIAKAHQYNLIAAI